MKMKELTNDQKRLANCERALIAMQAIFMDTLPASNAAALDKMMSTFFYTNAALSGGCEGWEDFIDEAPIDDDVLEEKIKQYNETNS